MVSVARKVVGAADGIRLASHPDKNDLEFEGSTVIGYFSSMVSVAREAQVEPTVVGGWRLRLAPHPDRNHTKFEVFWFASTPKVELSFSRIVLALLLFSWRFLALLLFWRIPWVYPRWPPSSIWRTDNVEER